MHLVLMRRNSDRLLKRSAKVMHAKPCKVCKFQEADLFAQMRFNILEDSAFLPTGEPPTTCRWLMNELQIDAG